MSSDLEQQDEPFLQAHRLPSTPRLEDPQPSALSPVGRVAGRLQSRITEAKAYDQSLGLQPRAISPVSVLLCCPHSSIPQTSLLLMAFPQTLTATMLHCLLTTPRVHAFQCAGCLLDTRNRWHCSEREGESTFTLLAHKNT
eukprot:1133646-Pelagomonas_calceolata.AAC.6